MGKDSISSVFCGLKEDELSPGDFPATLFAINNGNIHSRPGKAFQPNEVGLSLFAMEIEGRAPIRFPIRSNPVISRLNFPPEKSPPVYKFGMPFINGNVAV